MKTVLTQMVWVQRPFKLGFARPTFPRDTFQNRPQPHFGAFNFLVFLWMNNRGCSLIWTSIKLYAVTTEPRTCGLAQPIY